jgi:hypothetical protein
VLSLQAEVRTFNDQEHNKTCSCFTIVISLTQLGMENIDEASSRLMHLDLAPGVSFIELVTRRVTRSVKGFIERVNGSRKGYLKRDLRVLGVTRSMKLTPVLFRHDVGLEYTYLLDWNTSLRGSQTGQVLTYEVVKECLGLSNTDETRLLNVWN